MPARPRSLRTPSLAPKPIIAMPSFARSNSSVNTMPPSKASGPLKTGRPGAESRDRRADEQFQVLRVDHARVVHAREKTRRTSRIPERYSRCA